MGKNVQMHKAVDADSRRQILREKARSWRSFGNCCASALVRISARNRTCWRVVRWEARFRAPWENFPRRPTEKFFDRAL